VTGGRGRGGVGVPRGDRARALDRDGPLPLWAQLLDDVVRRLEADAFADRFPSEHELVAQYDVSRHTVREALRRLRESGVINSHRGRLTVVRRGSLEQPLGALYSLFREVEARGMEQLSAVRARDVRTDAAAAAVLQLAEDAPLVYIERLRYADDEPLAWDRTWLPVPIGKRLLTADLTHSGLYDELHRGGIVLTGGREHIEAVVPTAEQRRLLGVRSRVAAMAIGRVGCMQGRPVEWRRTLVRGDRFSVTAEWSATKGYRLDVGGAAPGRG
jgi:GntR family transcriptional regulator